MKLTILAYTCTLYITQAICCPDFVIEDSSSEEEEEVVDMCRHGMIRSECPHCGICPHGMVFDNCPECQLCPHGLRRGDCYDCGICEHGNVRCQCVECNTEVVTETHVHVVQDTLPAPWVMYTDKDSGQPYYYNTLTGETRWVRPGESAADFKGPKLSRVEQTEDNATYKWSAGTGRRIHATDEERLAHAQGYKIQGGTSWKGQFKKDLNASNTTML